jgi:fluoride exporter
MNTRFDRYRYLLANRFRKVVVSKDMETFLLISLGAIVGANLRYWIGVWAADRLGHFLSLTATSSSTLQAVSSWDSSSPSPLTASCSIPRWRIFFAVGFLGSYTTFSSYTFESLNLIMNNQWLLGLFNLFGSAFLGGVAVFLGIITARAI